MRSFRVSRASRLFALAALALQMVVSFGHVHLDGIHRPHPGVGIARAAARAAPLSPASQPGDDDGYCAVCAAIYLAANSFIPQAPQLVVPFASRPIERVDRVAVVFVAPWRTPIQSRAPPQPDI
jgi:hypothetical protein